MRRGRKEEVKRRNSDKPLIIAIIAVIEIIVFLLGFLAGTIFKKVNPAPQVQEPVINNVEKIETPQVVSNPLVDSIMKDMSLEDMIYQMMFVTPEAITNVDIAVRAGESTKNALQSYPVGGIIYFEQNYESDEQITQMIENSQSYSKVPLFIATDDENFANNKELGINMNFVSSDNFSNDSEVNSVLKYYPNYSSSYLGSDDGYCESAISLDELKTSEYAPFKDGIDKGAEFIMVSHINLPNATTNNVPASVSKEVITDILKNELGFKGIVITDYFNKAAITDEFSADEAAVKAVSAGCDIILMPENIEMAHQSLVTAVENGEIPKTQIEESVRKILTSKANKGLIK